LDSIKEVEFSWAVRTLPSDTERMVIPCSSPHPCIFVDLRQEQMMHKPNMSIKIDIQAIVQLQILKELLPLAAKT